VIGNKKKEEIMYIPNKDHHTTIMSCVSSGFKKMEKAIQTKNWNQNKPVTNPKYTHPTPKETKWSQNFTAKNFTNTTEQQSIKEEEMLVVWKS
jgi:hypothetical protein